MKFILYKPLLIKKFAAVFLLGIFTLAITPKKTLHRLLANHTDKALKSNDGKTKKIGTSGFNCKCENLVAESNFINSDEFIFTTPTAFQSAFTLHYNSIHSFPRLLFNLRGPPLKF